MTLIIKMEELSDKDFDQIFKNRIKDGYLEYEEKSWLKMEKKLRKRNQYIFLRNASIILLFLSFGIGIYVLSGEKLKTQNLQVTKKPSKINQLNIDKPVVLNEEGLILEDGRMNRVFSEVSNKQSANFTHQNGSAAVKYEITLSETPAIVANNSKIENSITVMEKSILDSSTAVAQNQLSPQNDLVQQQRDGKKLIDESRGKSMAKPGITLSILVGPDFNSTENAIGGKSGVAVGIGVSVPLTKKLSMQTGLNYGLKNYKAEGYDYTFNNPNTVNSIAGIEASCKVLEIPLGFSYNLAENQKGSLHVNAGLSSYMMLKENYRFIYTEASGRKDRFLEEKNANQHYFSVVDLSATYNIKLKNKKVALGVQPYVKIPLAGIGEGNVPLKSSGISLKLNYEFSKKR